MRWPVRVHAVSLCALAADACRDVGGCVCVACAHRAARTPTQQRRCAHSWGGREAPNPRNFGCLVDAPTPRSERQIQKELTKRGGSCGTPERGRQPLKQGGRTLRPWPGRVRQLVGSSMSTPVAPTSYAEEPAGWEWDSDPSAEDLCAGFERTARHHAQGSEAPQATASSYGGLGRRENLSRANASRPFLTSSYPPSSSSKAGESAVSKLKAVRQQINWETAPVAPALRTGARPALGKPPVSPPLRPVPSPPTPSSTAPLPLPCPRTLPTFCKCRRGT